MFICRNDSRALGSLFEDKNSYATFARKHFLSRMLLYAYDGSTMGDICMTVSLAPLWGWIVSPSPQQE